MATSSIFTNFTIADKKSADRFLDALDKAAQQKPWKSSFKVKPLMRDPEVIKAMLEKKKK